MTTEVCENKTSVTDQGKSLWSPKLLSGLLVRQMKQLRRLSATTARMEMLLCSLMGQLREERNQAGHSLSDAEVRLWEKGQVQLRLLHQAW